MDVNLWLHSRLDIPEAEVLREKNDREDDSNLLLILECIKEQTFSPKGATPTQGIGRFFEAGMSLGIIPRLSITRQAAEHTCES